MPVSCTELKVQVGLLKVHGLTQLMLLAAAAAEPHGAVHVGPLPSVGGAAVTSEGGRAAARPSAKPAVKSSTAPASQVLKAVACMPEKVRRCAVGPVGICWGFVLA